MPERSRVPVPGPDTTTLDWLLAGDAALQWQVLQDVVGAPAREVALARARVATEGWGATVLAAQAPDGYWGGVAWNHGWDSTMHALTMLREFGLAPASDAARSALDRVRAHVRWKDCGPLECEDNPFLSGEVEPCINGQVASASAYFGEDVGPLVDRLVAEQLPDGGWNCDVERGSRAGAFHTTICVLEALLARERQGEAPASVRAARARGEAWLLDRHLFHRRSTGAPVEVDRKVPRGMEPDRPAFTRFAFPNWWHYDVLRGLDYLRAAGCRPDARCDAAIALLVSRRGSDGRWLLDRSWPGTMLVDLGEAEGAPSRWITLRALRVLRWYAAG